jgi:hypothetical protein
MRFRRLDSVGLQVEPTQLEPIDRASLSHNSSNNTSIIYEDDNLQITNELILPHLELLHM